MNRTRLSAAWRRGQRGWPAAYPVAQFPNAPLATAGVAGLVARASTGAVRAYAAAASRVALAVWGADELTRGDNAWRRVLGAVTLARVVAEVAGPRR